MNKAAFSVFILILSLVFLVACVTEPELSAIREITGEPMPATAAVQTPSPTPAGPALEWWSFGGYSAEGVLIEEWTITEESGNVSYWYIDRQGFVQTNGIWSRFDADDEPAQVMRARPEEREQIIKAWRDRGFDARLINADGSSEEVSNFFIRYYPPQGYVFSPPNQYMVDTSITIFTGASVKTLNFSEIAAVEIEPERVIVELRSGDQLSGTLLTGEYNQKPYIARFTGVIYGYRILQVEAGYNQIKRIEFLSWLGEE